jgi:hypothetical protein
VLLVILFTPKKREIAMIASGTRASQSLSATVSKNGTMRTSPIARSTRDQIRIGVFFVFPEKYASIVDSSIHTVDTIRALSENTTAIAREKSESGIANIADAVFFSGIESVEI